MSERRRVLLLYWQLEPRRLRAAILHHLRVLDHARVPLRVLYCNIANGVPAWLRHFDFDAVILHTTALWARWYPDLPMRGLIDWIADLGCVKIAMPQDEYDHSEVLDEWLAELGVSVIVSNFEGSQRQVLYPVMSGRARFIHGFTGYIDEATAIRLAGRLSPPAARPSDIVYRATHLPYWFGSQGQLKHRVGDVVAEAARRRGLVCDVSTRPEDTLVGDAWFEFLMSGRCVLGCESGSSVLDRRGEIARAIKDVLREEPMIGFAELSRRMPPGWDDYRFYALSPRHFEAVITKTCQVLVEGRYDGVLDMERHYIPLRRDFSNLDEVLDRMQDVALVGEVAERAYEDIYRSGRYTYRRLAAELEEAILAYERPRWRKPDVVVGALWAMARPVLEVREEAGTLAGRLARRLHPLAGARGLRQVPPRELLAAARLIGPHRALRRLLGRYLATGDTWRTIGLDRVLSDLLRVGLLSAARRRSGRLAVPFDVAADLDVGAGRLDLRSHPDDQARRLGWTVDAVALEQALRAGRLTEMEWDHAAIGPTVAVRVLPGYTVQVGLEEGTRYRFTALVALLNRFPDLGVALYRTLAEVPPSRGRLLGRFVRRPRVYAALGLTVLRAVARAPALRRLLVAYGRDRDAHREVGFGRLLADLLRLTVVRRALIPDGVAASGFCATLTYDPERGAVRFRSQLRGAKSGPSGDPAVVGGGPLRRIEWDHSAVGRTVPVTAVGGEPLEIGVGPDGVWQFDALGALARRCPKCVWPALLPGAARPSSGTPAEEARARPCRTASDDGGRGGGR